MSGAKSAKVVVPLAYDQRSDAAASAVLRALLDVIATNRRGAVDDPDTEYLHRLRISVRRSRTVQRQLSGVFPAIELPGYRREFRWLQSSTGEARDLDVYLLGFDDLRAMVGERLGADLGPLYQVLEHWRLSSRHQMARALASRRTDELLADWEILLESLVELPTDDRPDAQLPIGQLAGRRIHKAYRRVVRMGRAIEASSPPGEYHELRKKGKELRYLLELFGTQLFAGDVTDDLVKRLKALQDVLGRHQDREVQITMLRSLADEVASLPRGPRAVMAMGALVDELQADEAAARAEFGERFAALAAKRERRLVKKTFT